MRALVHEPMKTRSIATSASGVPGTRSMYASVRRIASRRSTSGASSGSGTRPLIGSASSGLLPQVTIGSSSDASSATSRSNAAPSSVRSACHSRMARSQSAPRGAWGRPARYANVVSSGAIIPERAPASIDMLHRVSRPSIDSARTVEPAYSIACPAAPAAPIRAMMARMTSFAVTHGPSAPSTVMRIVFGRACQIVCVASTCATSVAPIPNASAPSAPCVDVWLSPHTISIPGRDSPCSGATTCTMPWRASSRPNIGMPARDASSCSAWAIRAASMSRTSSRRRLCVGM